MRESNGELIGICPFFITNNWPFRVLDSLPESDIGGPLIINEHKKNAAYFLRNSLKKNIINKHISYVRIRLSDADLCDFIKSNGSFIDTSSGSMGINLLEKPCDFIWNSIFKKADQQRKTIRHFEKDGFILREARNKEDLVISYNMYHKHMTEHVKIKGSEFEFFKNMWELLYPENFRIFISEKDGDPIAFIGFFIDSRIKTLHSMHLGYFPDKLSSRYNISYYLNWNALRWAEENGFHYFNFGSTPSDTNSKYFKIKRMLGADFNQNYIVFIPIDRKKFILRQGIIKYGKRIKKNLPERLVRRIGRSLR